MSDTFSKLQNEKVEPSLKKFQDGAVGSIEMLSVGFYGIIEAFKDEMEKSRDIEEKIEKSVDDINILQQELSNCNEKCIDLNQKLNDEIKKMKKCLTEQSIEIDKKLVSFKESVNSQCNDIKKQCFDAVETISNKVGKSLENVDRLKEQFENLEMETNDQLRSLSVRCEENKELILEQDNKFKDQLNELTQILHNKALELDGKIENCLTETTNKIQQFDEKQQNFQFEMNRELSQKADIEDLKHKLDINEYQEFMQNKFNTFTQETAENINNIKTDIDNQQSKQIEISDDITQMKSNQENIQNIINEKFAELQSMINNPVDIESIKNEISEQILDEQSNFRQEMIELIQSASNGQSFGISQPPSLGTQNGNCIACGRGPSQFQPLPCKSPSPTKKPKHGGGFNRLPSRRKSVADTTNVQRRLLKSCESGEIDGIRSPTSASSGNHMTSPTRRRKSTSYLAEASSAAMKKRNVNKTYIENDPVRVQIANIDDD